MAKGPSAHLTWEELACRDSIGTPYPIDWTERAHALAAVFEAIRAACGNRPITVLSAYRTPTHNAAVGGAHDSQHVMGRALDLQHSSLAAIDMGNIIRALAATTVPAIGGVGQYETFVHVDIRPRKGGQLATWEG